MLLGDAVDLAQERGAVRAHDDEALRERVSSSITRALQRIRLGEDRVQRRDDRHAQLAEQREHVAAGLAAEDAVLVLHAHDVDGVDVQEVRGAPVRREVALGDLEANARGIGVALPASFIASTKQSSSGTSAAMRVAQIGRERGDAALARQVIAEHRDLANHSCFHRASETIVFGERVGAQD